MNKIWLSIAVICLFPIGSVGQSNRRLDPRWERIDTSDERTISYDTKTLTTAPSIVKAWIRFDFSPKGRLQELNKRSKRHDSLKGYNELAYRLYYWEFNCITKQQHVLRVLDYARNGKTLSNTDLEDVSEWEDIAPTSVGETVLSSVCYAGFRKRMNDN